MPRAMTMVRAGVGVTHLALPGLGGSILIGAPFGRFSRAVVRVLGARQVVQAGLTGVRPTAAVLALGAEVDALHSASMIALAVFSRRWRRAGLLDAAVAGVLAWAGLSAARSAPDQAAVDLARGAGLWALRDRWASSLAGPLVPKSLHDS